MDATKLAIVVTAGLIPFEPEESFTRRWEITSSEWEAAQAADEDLRSGSDHEHAFHAALKLAFVAAEADEYARLLRNPGRFNFVRTDWVWM